MLFCVPGAAPIVKHRRLRRIGRPDQNTVMVRRSASSSALNNVSPPHEPAPAEL